MLLQMFMGANFLNMAFAVMKRSVVILSLREPNSSISSCCIRRVSCHRLLRPILINPVELHNLHVLCSEELRETGS